MKRVKCPKCDTFIVFDETKYKQGQALVFKCKECKKEFGIRIGLSKLNAIHEEKSLDEHQFDKKYGYRKGGVCCDFMTRSIDDIEKLTNENAQRYFDDFKNS